MAYTIGGTTVTYIARTDWLDQPVAQSLAGETVKSRWKIHRWQTNVMNIQDWDNIYALEGTIVPITTNDYADRNNQTHVLYPEANFRSMTGSHDGPLFTNVTIEFLVRVV